MHEMVYVIALVRCVSGQCEFSYPAPDLPASTYNECKEQTKLFDYALAGGYWKEVSCIELSKDKLRPLVPDGWVFKGK